MLANPSPIQQHIRADIFSDASATGQSLQEQTQKPTARRIEEAEQFISYIKSQRQYITLVERYNPGVNMTEEEKVRLSARRVGMNLPSGMYVKTGNNKE